LHLLLQLLSKRLQVCCSVRLSSWGVLQGCRVVRRQALPVLPVLLFLLLRWRWLHRVTVLYLFLKTLRSAALRAAVGLPPLLHLLHQLQVEPKSFVQVFADVTHRTALAHQATVPLLQLLVLLLQRLMCSRQLLQRLLGRLKLQLQSTFGIKGVHVLLHCTPVCGLLCCQSCLQVIHLCSSAVTQMLSKGPVQ
jgi:hypothetical protein